MSNKINKLVFALVTAITLAGCSGHSADSTTDSTTSMKKDTIARQPFDQMIDGKEVRLYTLINHQGITATITNYGGRLVSLLIPGRDGKDIDVVAGYSTIAGYVGSTERYFGATIGRYGNRTAKGKFILDGKEYSLFINNKPNTLHGGKKGFQDVVWDARQVDDHTLELSYFSKDMEEGFPGNLKVRVTYELTKDNALKISYHATTDKNTVINLTNHAFFNLNGEASGTILEHLVKINAARYTPVDSTLIPTGKIVPVQGTPFDFTKAVAIGARINTPDEQLKNGKGYDHNFVLDTHSLQQAVATVTGDKSGIRMDIYTDQPGLQFYSGNFMRSRNTMKGGHKDDPRTAFAMETQHFPDSPNQPAFPSTLLKAGSDYNSVSIYKFHIPK